MVLNGKSIHFYLARVAALAAALILAGGAYAAVPVTPDAPQQGEKNMAQKSAAVESAVGKVTRALVRIHVVEARYDDGRSLKSEASGSGVIISPDGYVVTNHHVAGDAVRLFCTMPNREEIPAELVGTDAMADIAVIRLKPGKPTRFDYAEFGDSTKLQVGDTVLAMGSPLSLSQSVTEGIVSNTEMTLPAMSGGRMELAGENVGSIVRWIGHDAAIFPGNSGGPLVNLEGKVIGINEISLGLGGAIPGNLARNISDLLIKEPNHEVTRGFLGLLMQPLFKHADNLQGAMISDVVEDSPAAKAGIKTGDILRKVGDQDVNVRFGEEMPPLNLYIASLPLGKPVAVTVERGGEMITKTLTPVKREKVQSRQHEYKQWGLTGCNLSIWMAIEMKRKDKNGLLVTSVNTGGPAGQSKPALQGGDIILKVGGEPVNNMNDLTSATAKLTQGKTDLTPVLVSFARQGEEMLTVVNVGVEDLNDPGREVSKSWIPVATQVLTKDLADALKIQAPGGVRVTQVYDSETSGTFALKVGDMILAVDGDPVPASEQHDVEVFTTLIRQYPIGTEVALTVLRDGKKLELKGKLTARPRDPREMPRYVDHDFDFTVRNVAYLDRMRSRWEDNPIGVLVESVEEGGWAALGRMGPGDLLMAVDGKPVNSVVEIKKLMDQIKTEKKTAVIFKVRRGVHNEFIEIEPLWKQDGQ